MNLHLVVLNPGHFHAALVLKQQLAGVDSHVVVYAPPEDDLNKFCNHISRFNGRAVQPTHWALDIRSSPNWFERFLDERPGNTVVIAGRNKLKIDLILAAVSNGYCVLSDKPWIIDATDFAKLERVYIEADRRDVFAWDIMTERFEVTSRVQRELMADSLVFGTLVSGSASEPAMVLESIHYLLKSVAGAPLRRPVWWFDPAVAGESLADVGTHLADLAMWLGFPNQPIDHVRDIELIDSRHWPTPVHRQDFQAIADLPNVPLELSHLLKGDQLQYAGNGTVLYKLRSHFVRLTALWGVRSESPDGDTHFSVARGSRATIVVQHDSSFGPGPHVFVVPAESTDREELFAVLNRHCENWSRPGVLYEVQERTNKIHIRIPDSERTAHESHFASVLNEFQEYFHHRDRIPPWERPNLLAKYAVTTHDNRRQ